MSNEQLKKEQVVKETKNNKDRIVRYRCDRPLVVDFDSKADKAGKNRSQVLRELMVGWVQEQQA